MSECPLQILRTLGGERASPVILDRCQPGRRCCEALTPALEERAGRLLDIRAELAPHGDGATYAAPHETNHNPLAGRLQKGCLDLIGQEVQAPVLGRLARNLGASIRQLNRMFRDAGLDSPAKEFRRLRLRRTLERVRTTTVSMEAIAEEMGYHDRASFVRAFVRVFGIAPASLRRRTRNQDPGG